MPYNVGGGAEPQQMRIGTTPIQKVMVGSVQVWPKPVTAVQFIAGAGIAGTWTHAPGDLLVLFGQTFSTTSPPIPTGANVPEWQPYLSLAGSSYGGTSLNLTVHYAFATASNHVPGTWTGQTRGWIFVLRNADPNNPFGSGSKKQDSSGGQYYPTAPALNMEFTNSKSFALYAIGWNNSSSLSWQSQPTGAASSYNATGSNGLWIGNRSASQNNLVQIPQVSGQLTGPANVTSGISLEVVPVR